MSDQPDQPQPYTPPPNKTPPDYNAPAVPPMYQAPKYQAPQYQTPQYPAPPFQAPQNPYGGWNQQVPAPAYGEQPFQDQYGGQNQQQFQYPQAPPYGAPAYYQGGPGYIASTAGPRGLSLTSMILGLVSLVLGAGFFIVPQIAGIILGHLGLGKENPQGRAFAVTGLITNYLALVIFGGLYLLLIIIGSAGSSYSSYS